MATFFRQDWFFNLCCIQLYKKFKQLGMSDRTFVYEAVGAYATTIDDEFLSYETPETVGYKVYTC